MQDEIFTNRFNEYIIFSNTLTSVVTLFVSTMFSLESEFWKVNSDRDDDWGGAHWQVTMVTWLPTLFSLPNAAGGALRLLWIANQLVTHSSLGVPELSAPQCWNKWPLKAIYYHNAAQEGRLCCEYKHLSQHQFNHKLLSTRPGLRHAKVFDPHWRHWRSRHMWFCSEKLSKRQRQHRHWLGFNTVRTPADNEAIEILSCNWWEMVRTRPS